MVIGITFIISLALFCISVYVSYREHFSDNLTIREMEKYEQIIRKKYENYINGFRGKAIDKDDFGIDIDLLTKDLKLQVKVSEDIPETYRSSLNEPDTEGYNGLILHSEDKTRYADRFDIIHEIVHYLVDVGNGKKVDKSFARVHRGNARGHREQIIDYYVAAITIPQDDLRKRISKHAGDPYDKQFIAELMEFYKQPEDTIIRRIGEVKVLS